MTKLSFKKKDEQVSDVLDLVHSNVCGPMNTAAMGGFSYLITFIDNYSRFGYVFLMRYKFESFEVFKRYRNEVEKQTRKDIKIL